MKVKEYLKQLPNKSHSHKKRFALLAAAGTTLVIAFFWSVVKFHEPAEVVLDPKVGNLAAPVVIITPFDDIVHGIKSTWYSIKNSINGGE